MDANDIAKLVAVLDGLGQPQSGQTQQYVSASPRLVPVDRRGNPISPEMQCWNALRGCRPNAGLSIWFALELLSDAGQQLVRFKNPMAEDLGMIVGDLEAFRQEWKKAAQLRQRSGPPEREIPEQQGFVGSGKATSSDVVDGNARLTELLLSKLDALQKRDEEYSEQMTQIQDKLARLTGSKTPEEAKPAAAGEQKPKQVKAA